MYQFIVILFAVTTETHHISKVVHLECKSQNVGILVVGLNVLLVGLPDDVSLQLLSLGLIILPMLRFPQLPLFPELELGSCQGQGDEEKENKDLHTALFALIQYHKSEHLTDKPVFYSLYLYVHMTGYTVPQYSLHRDLSHVSVVH